MKVDKWISQSIYVDQHTGEQISTWTAQEHYIIIRKEKHIRYEQQLNRKSKNIETIGVIEYTNICTRQGKQLKLV